MAVLSSSTRKIFSPATLVSRHKSTLAFKHDPSNQALVFYTRDPHPEEQPLRLDPAFVDRYLDLTRKGGIPMQKHGNQLVPECRKMVSRSVLSVVEDMGRMPRKREFTVCAISKLVSWHKAFTVGFPEDGPVHVRLKPEMLFSRLLEEEFEQEGKMDMEAYRRLKKMVAESCYVRHGIEIDLRHVSGVDETRCVVFPRKINRKEITRCLSMAGIRMRRTGLRIFRPENTKMIPTRCVVVPACKRRQEGSGKDGAKQSYRVPEGKHCVKTPS